MSYILLALGIFIAWKMVRGFMLKKKIPDFLKRGAVVIDVRSEGEFLSGANSNSINVPLDEIENKLKSIPAGKPLIVCCASGMRSAIAERILKKKGFHEILNAGAWTNINIS